MTNRVLIIEACEDCPYYDYEYYDYAQKCTLLDEKTTQNEIPDNCPLDKTDEPVKYYDTIDA